MTSTIDFPAHLLPELWGLFIKWRKDFACPKANALPLRDELWDWAEHHTREALIAIGEAENGRAEG
jgi:hypothetical protein